MNKISLLFFMAAIVLIGLQYIGPSLYRECGTTDGHSSAFQLAVYEINKHEKIYLAIFILLALAITFFVIQTLQNKSYTKRRRALTTIIATPVIVCLFALSLINQIPDSYGPDYQRLHYYINNARAVLELYYDDHSQRYPGTSKEAAFPMSQIDPVTNESYGYAAADDGQSYVLRVPLGIVEKGCFEPTSSTDRLKDDLDGMIFGLDCTDPFYCVGYSTVNDKLVEFK